MLTVFDWFFRLRRRKRKIIDLGAKAAQGSIETLEKFIVQRFYPVRDGYLSILKNNMSQALNSIDAPPLVMAEIYYEGFLEEVAALQEKIVIEVVGVMGPWIELAAEIEASAQMKVLIEKRVDEFRTDLAVRGFELFLANAELLKLSDVTWRKLNPEKSTDFPESA